MLARIRTTWRALRRRATWERELDDELRLHIELRAADLMRGGAGSEDAVRQARLELGPRESYKEQARAAFGLRWFDELRQDLRYAVRTLRRSPGFTAVAVISLALGIGANTAVFGVLNALVFRPLPISAPDQVYVLQGPHPSFSFPVYRDFRDRNVAFAGLAGSRLTQVGVDAGTGAERAWGFLVTGNFFDVLGVRPALGRFFHAEDDRLPGASPYVVLSYDYWQNRFQSDPNIVGRTFRINTRPYTVLGVAPRGFQGTEVFIFPEVWIPMMMEPLIETPWLENRASTNTWVVGRLKPGVTAQRAEANLSAIAGMLAKEHPNTDSDMQMHLARPGLVGDEIRTPVKAFIGGVLLLAGLVLLAACANLVALLSARATDRFREMAIRVSIGAGRGRIARQLMTEAVLLALIAGACGSVLALGLLRALGHWQAPLDFPVRFQIVPDYRVLVFALLVSTLTGVLFGMAPARHAWRLNPNDSLKGTQSGREGRWPLRDLLFAGQFALCCLVVTGSFVAWRGLAHAVTTPAGFQPRGVAVLSFDLGLAGYATPETGRAFQRRALDEMVRLPGVEAAAYASSVPLSIDQSGTRLFREDATDLRLSSGIPAAVYQVSPGYFAAMQTRLRAGRDFTWRDDAQAPAVAIVNQTLARRLTGTEDAVGRRFRGRGRLVEIVGVVEDGKYTTLTEVPKAVVFWPQPQTYNSQTVVIVRSSLPEPVTAEQMEEAIRRLDRTLPVFGLGSLSEMLGFVLLPARAATLALGAFGILAAMLAITGIAGLANYAVSRRVREIGIRVALGAGAGRVLRSVLGRMTALLCVGLVVGLAAGAAASRVLANIVFQATSRDPVVIGGVILSMAVAALAAALGPARRALSLDPLRALRHE